MKNEEFLVRYLLIRVKNVVSREELMSSKRRQEKMRTTLNKCSIFNDKSMRRTFKNALQVSLCSIKISVGQRVSLTNHNFDGANGEDGILIGNRSLRFEAILKHFYDIVVWSYFN